MPGVSRDMNGYGDFERGHLRTSSYANGYNDPYRYDRGMPRDQGRNGVDTDHNSFDNMGVRDGNEPSFEVDHLATYTSKSGTTQAEDGLTKLKQMESTTGIWTMRCMMIVERRQIVIIDKGNGDELERFPLAQVHDPTAVLKNDRRETYNNLVLFTIVDDPRRKNSPSDMHIFQSVTAPAHDIVDEILSAKGEGGRRGAYDKQIPPPPSGPAPEPPYGKLSSSYRATVVDVEPPIETRLRETRLDDPPTRLVETGRFNDGRGYGVSRVGDFRASYIHKDDMDTGQNEALERDVQLLNSCFDDIEKFVSRLQQAAEAYKELERRRVERGGKRKQKSAGDGMLSMRARPPPSEDFIDIFQKFKFAFNLLAKLKAHIHDPNAPELVHFLFTPLSLIYEASRDPIHGYRDLSGDAVSPLLLLDAKQLLLNCLTSKEMDLWQRLGKSWTQPREEFVGSVPPYNPRFYNGFQPSPQYVDEINQGGGSDLRGDLRATERSIAYPEPMGMSRRDDPYISRTSERREDPYRMTERRDDYRSTERREDPYRMTERREDPYRMTERRDELYSRDIRSTERRDDYNRPPSPTPARGYEQSKRSSVRDPMPAAPRTRAEENQSFSQDLKRMGATIYEAVHERQGKNPKELTVEKGDIVQVLDKSRNWWKLKNYQGETGYAPYTILKEHQPRDDYDHNAGGQRVSGEYNGYISGGAPPPAPPPMSNRGGRGEPETRQRLPPPTEVKPTRTPAGRQQPRPHGEKSMYSDDLHHELRTKMNTSDDRSYPSSPRGQSSPQAGPSEDPFYSAPSPRGQRERPSSPVQSPRANPRVSNLSQYSTADEVKEWLGAKGFSRRCMDLLQGYSGLDLFGLDRHELERLLGRDEGRHLDSLMMVQKNNAGYRTRGASELRAILQKRKDRVETNNQDDGFGYRPSFMPETPPDYSPPESEVSSDDFGDAGKTLRNLLERQRKKIQQGGYKGPYQ